jgi:hypothetical protein
MFDSEFAWLRNRSNGDLDFNSLSHVPTLLRCGGNGQPFPSQRLQFVWTNTGRSQG